MIGGWEDRYCCSCPPVLLSSRFIGVTSRLVLATLVLIAAGGRLEAQELRGMVVDSTNRRAIAGAVLVNYAKTYLTGAFPEIWLYALGALFVLVTLFLPRGIIGLVQARVKQK